MSEITRNHKHPSGQLICSWDWLLIVAETCLPFPLCSPLACVSSFPKIFYCSCSSLSLEHPYEENAVHQCRDDTDNSLDAQEDDGLRAQEDGGKVLSMHVSFHAWGESPILLLVSMVKSNHPPERGAEDEPRKKEGWEAGEESEDPPLPAWFPNNQIF